MYDTASDPGATGDPACDPNFGCTTTITMLDTTNNLEIKWQTVVMNASDPEDDCFGCFK